MSVTYTTTTMTDSAAPFVADTLIGLPITIWDVDNQVIYTAWITDNTAGVVTFGAIAAAPRAGSTYYIGGIAYHAKFGEAEYEDVVFFGTGLMRWVADAVTKVYSVLSPDEQDTLLGSHDLFSDDGAPVPVVVPFTIGGNSEQQTHKLYADRRAARLGMEFWEHNYTGTPELVRVDMPVKRLTRTRRR